MLLFGKTSFSATGGTLLRSLLRQMAAAPRPSRDQARQWLAAAGQIEQALADAQSPAAEAAMAMTDAAAALLLFAGDAGASPGLLSQAADRVVRQLDRRMLRVAVPEGFAWYALYPDAYAATAERWLAAQKGQARRCCVIGLRSIGTALSAVVAARLRLSRISVQRVTVRPEGSPFARTARLPMLQPADAYIVVDEGPGLSGSSMAGVAEALARTGVSGKRIVFFPSHGKGPGPEASDAVRGWWNPERVWVTDGMEKVRSELRDQAAGWLDAPVSLSEPPQRVSHFEMPQIVAQGETGDVVRFWFGGFAAIDAGLTPRVDRLAAVQTARAAAGLAMPVLGIHAGWMACAGARGRVLSTDDQTPCLVRNGLAPALLLAAKNAEDEGSVTRIVEAIEAWREERAPEVTLAGLAAAARCADEVEELRGFGDGDLGPAAFARSDDGTLMKLTPGGHECGHGWAGRQSILWDVAGAAVEWRLTPALSEALIHLAGVDQIPPMVMQLHRAGYCCQHLAVALHRGSPQTADLYEVQLRDALARMAEGT